MQTQIFNSSIAWSEHEKWKYPVQNTSTTKHVLICSDDNQRMIQREKMFDRQISDPLLKIKAFITSF